MRKSAGFSLIETTVAVALTGVIVVAILSAFSSVSIAATRHQQQTTLDRLTRSDAEYIKSQTYAATYLSLSPLPAGYSLSYQVQYYAAGPSFSTGNPDIGLEEIVLTVSGPNSTNERLVFLKVQP